MTTKAQTALGADIQWDVIEGTNSEFAAQYPRMQWVHGSKQAAGFMKTGGLFISQDQYPNFTGEGFTATTLITRDGTEIEGFAASKTDLAIIRIKHQWVKDETYGRNVPLAHALCVVKGCPDLICISLRGASKALDFQKAFNAHMAQNVSFANRTRPQNAPALEPFALWFPVAAGEQVSINSKDGKSSSAVTLPTLVTPDKLDREYVVTLWVGAENYKTFAGYYRETTAWQKQPIWEQRNGEELHDTPTHSGSDDRITPQQIDVLGSLIEVKHLDDNDVKEMVLAATNGATNQLRNLTGDEAAVLIDTMRSA